MTPRPGRRATRRGGIHVAVLGAGIMGCALSLFLARRGIAVDLFDAEAAPMSCASRWNEGKIHLGFLYNRDATLDTARRLMTGGLLFKPTLEELIGCRIDPASTRSDDLYLCHRRSVVDAETMGAYFRDVAGLLHRHPDARRYPVDVSACRIVRLSDRELGAVTGSPDIVAGFRVPERSVSTRWVADRVVDAVEAEPAIRRIMDTRITGVRPSLAGDVDGAWLVESGAEGHGPYDRVINCLWQGRLAVDLRAGLTPVGPWSSRYRVAVFAHTRTRVDVPCAIIATGPFGDVKSYGPRDFYLSWYPEGLLIDSRDPVPPPAPALDAAREALLRERVLDALEALLPGVAAVRTACDDAAVRGGWVFATGEGLLSDPESSLHRRVDFGVVRRGAYFSVDTGKYSTAPWMAREIAARIA